MGKEKREQRTDCIDDKGIGQALDERIAVLCRHEIRDSKDGIRICPTQAAEKV